MTALARRLATPRPLSAAEVADRNEVRRQAALLDSLTSRMTDIDWDFIRTAKAPR